MPITMPQASVGTPNDALETLLYQRGFEAYDPIFHAYKVGLPGYGVVNIHGKTYIYNTRNVQPNSLEDLGFSMGKTDFNAPKTSFMDSTPLNLTNDQINTENEKTPEQKQQEQSKKDSMQNLMQLFRVLVKG